MFDVEAVFIFPWAVAPLQALGTFGLVEMVIFIFILALGLAYAWRKGVLRCGFRRKPLLRPGNVFERSALGLVESGKIPKSLTTLLNMSRILCGHIVGFGLLRNRDGRSDRVTPL